MNRMTRQLVLFLMAALIGLCPIHGEQYLTEAQALKLVFPQSAQIEIETKAFSDADRQAIKKQYEVEIPGATIQAFIGKTGTKTDGYALIMNEIGKSDPITFIVAVDLEGKVRTVAIMEFRETRGWEVKEPRFLRQFNGKKSRDHIRVNDDIINLSGATLSSYAVAKGVKKAVVLVDYFFIQPKR